MYEKIGKYHVIRAAGAGGFGTVYEGYDSELDRNVAIKLCKTDDEDQLERFRREARIVSQLKHRNIALVYEFGFDPAAGIHYLIEEFLSGVDLEKKIEERDCLPPVLRVRYLMNLAQGLAVVHEKGLIHRDLSPKNIRVLHDHTIKIMDFGLAKDVTDSTLTLAGDNFGTIGYTAPEQLSGMRLVDHRTDIFSFGVIAYELLTYTNPFHADDMAAFLNKTHHCEPTPINELWPACPAELAEVIHRCMRKSPEDRFSSCAEIISAMKKVRALLRKGGVEKYPGLPQPASPDPSAAAEVGELPNVDQVAPTAEARQVGEAPQVNPPAVGERANAVVEAESHPTPPPLPSASWPRRIPMPAYLMGAAILTALLLVVFSDRWRSDSDRSPTAEPRASESPRPDAVTDGGSGAEAHAPETREPPASVALSFALTAHLSGTPERPLIRLEANIPTTLTDLSHCYITREPGWTYGTKVRRECGGGTFRHDDRVDVRAGARYRYRVLLANVTGEILAESSTSLVVESGG